MANLNPRRSVGLDARRAEWISWKVIPLATYPIVALHKAEVKKQKEVKSHSQDQQTQGRTEQIQHEVQIRAHPPNEGPKSRTNKARTYVRVKTKSLQQ
jgi:hypothetical protein